ncbi:MAG: SRPBCC domain-containing protein [Bacteroidetes bacterium]|nr:SRPBCC domain-containing protein [Bacteroidota bacterium]
MHPVFRYYLFTLLGCLLFPIASHSQILCTPNEIRTEIIINTSAAEAWQLLTDIDAYALWHPYILQIEGKVALKEKIKVTTIDADSTTDKFSAFILVFEPNKQLAWGGSLGFIFSAKHYYIIEPINDNQILLFRGILAWIIRKKLWKKDLPRNLPKIYRHERKNEIPAGS